MQRRPDVQFTSRNSDEIRSGKVTVSFRNWRRPHAKVGGVYRLRPTGAVKVTRLASARLADVTVDDAARAGFQSVEALVAFLGLARSALVTRVEFALTDDMPKATPSLTPDEVVKRLNATDRRSAAPWRARSSMRRLRAKRTDQDFGTAWRCRTTSRYGVGAQSPGTRPRASTLIEQTGSAGVPAETTGSRNRGS